MGKSKRDEKNDNVKKDVVKDVKKHLKGAFKDVNRVKEEEVSRRGFIKETKDALINEMEIEKESIIDNEKKNSDERVVEINRIGEELKELKEKNDIEGLMKIIEKM